MAGRQFRRYGVVVKVQMRQGHPKPFFLFPLASYFLGNILKEKSPTTASDEVVDELMEEFSQDFEHFHSPDESLAGLVRFEQFGASQIQLLIL